MPKTQSKGGKHRYRLLLTNEIKTILESGLLLDEDYEVLVKASDFSCTLNEQNRKLPFNLIVCGVASLASIIFARKYNQPLVVIVTAGLSITKLCLDLNLILKENRRKVACTSVIESLIKVRKLNKTIFDYLKTRAENNLNTKARLVSSNYNITNFLRIYIEASTEILHHILNELNVLCSLTEELNEDFQEINDLNVVATLHGDPNLENSVIKVYDLHVLLTSKFLNYLGISFNKLLNDISCRTIEHLLDDILPKLTNKLNTFCKKLQNEFQNIKYGITKKQEIKNRKPLKEPTSGKLHQVVNRSVNNLALIMEKYHSMLINFECLDEITDPKEFELSLINLRDHALSTYETLDILCKLYGNLLHNKNIAKEKSDTLKVERANTREPDVSIKNICFDDEIQPLEEKYEMYLEKDDNAFLNENFDIDENQSAAYLNLIIKELKQSLSQHDTFIKAKSKSDIKDEDQKSEEKIENASKSFPEFELPAVSNNPNIEQGAIDSIQLPVPIAPPLPQFQIKEIEKNSESSLSYNIKTLSSQVDRKEDTFGDSGSDSDESNCN